MDKEWVEVSIITTSVAAEMIQGCLYTMDVKGVSVVDSQDLEFKKKHPGDWDYFDEEILDIKEGAVIKAYFKQEENLDDVVKKIKDSLLDIKGYGFDVNPAIVEVNKVDEEDWESNWKKYYKTTRVGGRVVIKPLWEEYLKKPHEVLVEMDPGMAFGTGTHETTRMCIQALERYVDEEKRVFDIGTGSGILAIVAAKLGSYEVIGGDLDPVAIDAASQNIIYNKESDKISIFHGDLLEGVKGECDVLVANIIADVIMFLTPSANSCVKDDGYFISSGIIKDRKEEVIDTLIKNNFEPIEVNTQGEWVCIVAKKHGSVH